MGDVKLNQKTRSVFRLSKRRLYNISGTAKGITLGFSRYVVGDVELNQQTQCASSLSSGCNCDISGMAKDTKLKLSGHFEFNQDTIYLQVVK